MSLEDQGWRFILRAGLFSWLHPADVEDGDVDCTNMDDNVFECLVLENTKGLNNDES